MPTAQIPKAERNRLIQKIHIAKSQLKLEEENYRALLQSITGHRSCSNIPDAQLPLVIQKFEELGFQHQKPKQQRYIPTQLQPHQRKVLALWLECRSKELITGGDRALDKFIRRQVGIDRLDWLPSRQSNKVIEALKAILQRNQTLAELEPLPPEPTTTDEIPF